MAKEKGVETARGVLESAEGICPGSREVADGLLCTLGPIDGGESARAGQLGQWPGVSAVRFDAITGLLGGSDGATPQQSSSFFVRYRSSQEPQGPASETPIRCCAFAGM